MFRTVAMVCALLALVLFVGDGSTADVVKNNQMVKGTIKSANPSTLVLVINQKVGNGVVDRELSITEKAEFIIKSSTGTDEVTGKAGLELLQEAAGSTVQVKCDKDVNVLRVTVTLKK
ncbi:hypothetical protein AYO44_01535 [Planctomycetaceae bacterium SCGC AG-212-F19]|nr:hypothetical protein AYO44_01535 [Planctomycetaceae bacterium SCGC AG-212-F19]